MTSDMYPHWRYVIEDILGPIRRVVTTTTTAIPGRVDDSAMTLVELASGATGAIVSSWATRVHGDDVLTLQVDGTGGSAVAGVHRCWAQSSTGTPTLRHINPDGDPRIDHRASWREVDGAASYPIPYRCGWEEFLRHVVAGTPQRADLRAGIRDVQLVEACYRSVTERRWIDMAP